MEGLLRSYKENLDTVEMAEPTNFSEVLNNSLARQLYLISLQEILLDKTTSQTFKRFENIKVS